MRWFVDRQRRVTTMVTNLRGPEVRLGFLGAPIIDVVPVAPITGNVTVGFAVLSYAGTLVLTVVADPRRCPDLPLLRDRLQQELDLLLAGPAGDAGRVVPGVTGAGVVFGTVARDPVADASPPEVSLSRRAEPA